MVNIDTALAIFTHRLTKQAPTTYTEALWFAAAADFQTACSVLQTNPAVYNTLAGFDRLLSSHKRFCVCASWLQKECRQTAQTLRLAAGERKLEWFRNNLCIIQNSFKGRGRESEGRTRGCFWCARGGCTHATPTMRLQHEVWLYGNYQWRRACCRIYMRLRECSKYVVHFALAGPGYHSSAARGASQAGGESEMYGRGTQSILYRGSSRLYCA